MKTWWGGLFAVALAAATAGCGASAPAPRAPAVPVTTESVVTVEEPTPVATLTAPPTTSSAAPAPTRTSAKATVRKTPTRKPPQYGYQCRDGDELKYEVCAGHKAWVDGQREFTDCLTGGGTWDEATQRCLRP
ncbi:MAG TPA: hypothetical protein VGL47_31650 [Amycolatopsis sp.]|uniref:Chitin-binding type-2 domain-containing protein n=1 Tax=Amycolatopsis nalaikhensis TaxID=715472 RepID=A0ABY8XIX5_9PSEU|nr:hypothetical protein [Amycolatopsis sp. 2-2]WIV55553.1 hypothetical protein QP939_43175 [Amycolatopsis sp. 2-2]